MPIKSKIQVQIFSVDEIKQLVIDSIDKPKNADVKVDFVIGIPDYDDRFSGVPSYELKKINVRITEKE